MCPLCNNYANIIYSYRNDIAMAVMFITGTGLMLYYAIRGIRHPYSSYISCIYKDHRYVLSLGWLSPAICVYTATALYYRIRYVHTE